MNPWIARLQTIADKNERLVAGMISGTSMDAIKVAICRVAGHGIPTQHHLGARVGLVHLSSIPYTPELKKRLYRCLQFSTQEISEMHGELGEVFSSALLQAIQEANLQPDALDLIGSHGQTIFHHSHTNAPRKSTLQIGDGDVIAERTGIPVISDFRARDIAAGGEGAPLTPYADAVFFANQGIGTVVLNMGGIANITVLDPNPEKIIGFDTGPANAPLDRLARLITQGTQTHDVDGKLAALGTVKAALLQELLDSDLFLKKSPPKSSGIEMYGDSFVDRLVAKHGAADVDLIATVTEFVARSIAGALESFVATPVQKLIVAGGGGRNPALLAALRRILPSVQVILSDEVGVPSQAREAMAFALFANDALYGVATSLPSVTGAIGGRVLGKVSIG